MRIQNNWNFNTSLAEMQNGTVTLENGLAVSNKVKHILTIKPCNWEFREMKIYVQTKDYTNIYSAFW